MNSLKVSLAFLALLLIGSAQARTASTDEKIKQQIIQQSIDSYPGSCPCPYNTDRGGRRCGGRSAYSRAGGYETICYDKDVTPAMIKAWRERN
jgi:hypothetical protein